MHKIFVGEVSPWGSHGRCIGGAQRAAPFLLFFTGRLNPHPHLGAAGYRSWQETIFRWAHPRTVVYL